jgi:hypothetical protein
MLLFCFLWLSFFWAEFIRSIIKCKDSVFSGKV